MSGIDIFILISAIPTWAVMSGLLLALLWRIAWSAIAAASITKWSFKRSALNGFKPCPRPVWTYIPGEFFRQWVYFATSHPGSITAYGPGGRWDGIGNWSIWKVEQGE